MWEVTNDKPYLDQLFYFANQEQVLNSAMPFAIHNIMCTNASKVSSYER